VALPKNITELLVNWSNGDEVALQELMPLVYDELHTIAGHHLRRGSPDNIIQPTLLVHELFLRLVNQENVEFNNRTHFFAVASKAMRQILVNYAVARRAVKRSGSWYKVSIDKAVVLPGKQELDIVTLDEALKNLATVDKRKSEIIELRFFGGLTLEEAAEVLGISLATINREWKLAKAWLIRELSR
jgi:RNA polymerase sigma factor (TIGR02999 family)